MELEGWRAYAEIQNRAKNAYHRTVRSQKRPIQRATVKQVLPKPMERKPYHILKQEQTKHIVENGRITPVKEIVDVIVQPPVEYKEDVEFMTTQALIESQLVKPVEAQQIVIPAIEITSHVTKRNSKETLKKIQMTPIFYQPTFTQLYLLPLIPYIILLLFIVCVMNL